MARRGYPPPEFRRRALELVDAGRKIADVVADLGISDQTIYTWRRQDRIAQNVGVSGTLETGKQLPYVVSGGMFGLFLLGLGALLWLSADLRDEWRKLDAIDRHLVASGALPDPAPPATAAPGSIEPVVPRQVSHG